MHKIAFLGNAMRASETIYALYLKVLTQRLLADFHSENASFTRKTAN